MCVCVCVCVCVYVDIKLAHKTYHQMPTFQPLGCSIHQGRTSTLMFCPDEDCSDEDCSDEDCSPAVETSAFDDMFCEPICG